MDAGPVFGTLALIGAIVGFLYGVLVARVEPGRSREWLKLGITCAAIGAAMTTGAVFVFAVIVGGTIVLLLIGAFSSIS